MVSAAEAFEWPSHGAGCDEREYDGSDCWAYVRRKFFEINEAQPGGFAHEVLESITTLYGIEKTVKGHSAQERYQMRQARAGPVLESL